MRRERGVQERSHVVPVVVRAVLFHVQPWRERRLLVPVDGVVVEEPTHLLVDGTRGHALAVRDAVHVLRVGMSTVVFGRNGLGVRRGRGPERQELLEHAPRTETVDLPQSTHHAELRVCHAHFHLIGLRVGVGVRGRDEFGRRRRVEEGLEEWELELVAGVREEHAQVNFGDTADRVDVG